VITRAVLDERVREWGLRDDVVEKDYVLGWLLWGIGANKSLGASALADGAQDPAACLDSQLGPVQDLAVIARARQRVGVEPGGFVA
jgi:hypothetical protein